jgi:hypothetical protein
VLRLNDGFRAPTGRKWNPNEVWETLRKVIAEPLDIPLDAVTADADLVYDLGAN